MSIQSISLPVAPAFGVSPQPAPQPAASQPAPQPAPQPVAQPDATAAAMAVATAGVAIPAASQATNAPDPSTDQVHAAVEKIKRALPPNATNLSFSIDKDSQKTVIKVIDSQTNQILKQFPSKEVLALAKQIGEFQESLGVLIRGQA